MARLIVSDMLSLPVNVVVPFDQQIKLFELRLHDVDVSTIEVHHLDQERGLTVCVSAPVISTRGFGTLHTRFGLVPLAPSFAVPASSAVPGYCRACLLSGFASLLGRMLLLVAPSATCRPSFPRSTSAQILSRCTPLQLR